MTASPRTRVDYCGGYEAAYRIAIEAKREIEQRGAKIYFRGGMLMRRYDSGEYRFPRVSMKSLLSEMFEFHCERDGRDRIVGVPNEIISRLICRTVGMRLWPEVT